VARRCVFCDEKATTREHALPEWVANRFDMRGTFLDIWGFGGAVPERSTKQPVSAKSMRRKMLCEDCQTHFKHLEDRVIPVLEPMGKGERMTLGPHEQATLAEWGAKTVATLFGFIDRERLIPDEHRRMLRQTGEPFSTSHVYVAYMRWGGSPTIFVSTPDLPSKDVSTPRLSYNAVAAFGQVALKVFGIVEPAPHDTFRLPKDRGVQVWPEWRVPFFWPPPIAMGDNQVADLIGFLPIAPDRDGPTYISDYPGIR
jgi:hypothetical protein